MHCFDGEGDLEYDNAEEKTGLNGVCKFINEELNIKMKGMLLSQAVHADNLLAQSSEAAVESELARRGIIRACSEALVFAVAKAYQPVDVWRGFGESLFPRDEESEGVVNTKLMISVLSGGKALNSAVKWGKIYLIIDAARCHMSG